MNNFFSQKTISKVVSINLMWIFFHQFFQTNFSWLIFVQSELSSENKMKYSMLLYSIIHINVYFFSYFSSLSWISLIFLFRANRAHFDVYLCVLQLQIDIFYMLCIPSNQKKILTIIIIKKTDVHLQHPVLFDVFLVMMCETHVLAYIIWMFIIWSSIRNTISINLVFFKGWSIILRCRLSKHWQWVEPAYYQLPPSMDSNQKDWVDWQADDILIQMKKIGASKGWIMIHDFHFRRSTDNFIQCAHAN